MSLPARHSPDVPSSSSPGDGHAAPGDFPSTIWSQVRRGAGDVGKAEGREALEQLARRYQGPALGFLRQAFQVDQAAAEDLLQAFFLRLLEDDFLARADPSRGRFRAFLKASLRHFANDEFRRRRASKKGGDRGQQGLEDQPFVDSKNLEPEAELDHAWRRAWIEEALVGLRQELSDSGKEATFALFEDYYLQPPEDEEGKLDYRALAKRHGVTTTDVSNRLMRAKRLFRRHLRDRVLETVDSESDLSLELSWLLEGGRP